MSTGRHIRLGRGFRLDKFGKPRRTDAHLDVSRRLQAKGSKRVRVARKGQVR
jgi:hypothetical protein